MLACFLLMSMNECFACMDGCLCTTVPVEARKEVESSRTGVPNGCELPCGHLGTDPVPLEEQPALLTMKQAVQPHKCFLKSHLPNRGSFIKISIFNKLFVNKKAQHIK